MKITNLLFKSLFVLIIFISFASCKPKISSSGEESPTVSEARPEQSISYKEMAVMLAQYKATRAPVLKSALGFEDTREVWFQIDSLKNYLAYVEKLSKDNGVEITGINFISAAYPDKPIYGKQKNYQTIILNPTTTKDGNPRVSFDPLYSKSGNPAFLSDLLLPYLSAVDSASYSKMDLEDPPSSAFNKGDGIPPND